MSSSIRRGARSNPKRTRRLPIKAKWFHLYEENEDFKIWYDQNAIQSQTTANEYARVLYRYLTENNLKLDKLTDIILTDNERFEKSLMAFANQLALEDLAPTYINNRLKPLRSWAKYNGKPIIRDIKVGNRNLTPSLDDEQVPTPEQVSDIRSNASLRGRICVGAIAYSGLRPEVLGHQHYEDGLRLGDLPELSIENLDFTKTPTQVVVRAELNKAGHTHRTFFPESTCRDIIAYLKVRKGQGEALTKDSPLIAVSSSHAYKGQRLTRGRTGTRHVVSAIVSRDIRNAMRPTYTQRPYVLRSYFSTRLAQAIADRVLDNSYRTYWMGHKGTMSAHYSTNRALLPDDLIENMRQAYTRCLPYLLGAGADDETRRKKSAQDTLKILRALNQLDDEQISSIEKILESSESVDDAIRLISDSGIAVMPSKSEQKKIRDEHDLSHGDYVIVSSAEKVAEYLQSGWEWRGAISPESPKADVDDEKWELPEGVTLSNGDKFYAFVKEDGTVEMRGNPSTLNGIEEELLQQGIQMSKIEPGPRYLLKKKKGG